MSRHWKKSRHERERERDVKCEEIVSDKERKRDTISTKNHQHFLEVFLQREELKREHVQICASTIH